MGDDDGRQSDSETILTKDRMDFIDRFCRKLVSEGDTRIDAEEVAQEVKRRCLEKLPEFLERCCGQEPEYSGYAIDKIVKSWIGTTCVNVYRERHRKLVRRRKREKGWEQLEPWIAHALEMEQDRTKREKLEDLGFALDSLSEADRDFARKAFSYSSLREAEREMRGLGEEGRNFRRHLERVIDDLRHHMGLLEAEPAGHGMGSDRGGG